MIKSVWMCNAYRGSMLNIILLPRYLYMSIQTTGSTVQQMIMKYFTAVSLESQDGDVGTDW